MVHRGSSPKSVKHGQTANADWVEVPDVPFPGPSPELPKLGRRKWHELVVQWWSQVRSMPHCVLWTPGDWQFAIETAIMKDALFREMEKGDFKSTSATEIRRRESMIGTTSEARRQLRIRYVRPAGESAPVDSPLAPVTQLPGIADRRARLTGTG